MIRFVLTFLIFCTGLIGGVVLSPGRNPDSVFTRQAFAISVKPMQQIVAATNGLLETVPHVSQVRLALIHAVGGRERTLADRFQYNVVVVAAPAGYPAGFVEQNLPLTYWDDYLPALIANKCPKILINDMTEESAKVRLQSLNGRFVMPCPVFSDDHTLRGAVFISGSLGGN
jgi:hypothetical protein